MKDTAVTFRWADRPMARRLRIQFAGAIDHVMSRGDARQDIAEDDGDRARLQELLGDQVARSRGQKTQPMSKPDRFMMTRLARREDRKHKM
jgi:hypothetical protein